MAFKVPTKISATTTTSSGGGYLNPSRVPSGGQVRFHLTAEEPLAFFECWGEAEDGSVKPFRFADDPSPEDIKAEMGPNYSRRLNREGTAPEPVKAALAFSVYNYETEQVQICQLTQKGLISELDSITQMEDYQPIDNFDFVLSKEGSGLTTQYTLRPVPAKKGGHDAAVKAQEAADAAGFDVNRLLVGGNPFKAD